jgi:ACT domain-containing protein
LKRTKLITLYFFPLSKRLIPHQYIANNLVSLELKLKNYIFVYCFSEGLLSAQQDKDLIVITVIGVDRPGIVAGIASVLASSNVNIEDISQTVLRGFFAMIMIADISKATCNLSELRERLEAKAKELGVEVFIQHSDIFRAMHRI